MTPRKVALARTLPILIGTVIFGVVAVGLGILFKGQNVAFLVGLAFAIAASANAPIERERFGVFRM